MRHKVAFFCILTKFILFYVLFLVFFSFLFCYFGVPMLVGYLDKDFFASMMNTNPENIS